MTGRMVFEAFFDEANHCIAAEVGSKSLTVGPSAEILINSSTVLEVREALWRFLILFCAEIAHSHWTAERGSIKRISTRNNTSFRSSLYGSFVISVSQRSLCPFSMKFEWTRTFNDNHCLWIADASQPGEISGAQSYVIKDSTFSLPKLSRASISLGQASWLETIRSEMIFNWLQHFSQKEMWAEAMTQTCLKALGGTTEQIDQRLFELCRCNGC